MGRYATIDDLRAEGIDDDGRVESVLIPLAEAAIERWTGFRFYSYAATLVLDGTGTRVLVLPQAILSITSVTVDTVAVDAGDYVVYNRRPPGRDDRRWPRLARPPSLDSWNAQAGGAIWAVGAQNVSVVGTFGFTDADAQGNERPPEEIRRLTLRLVALELARLGDLDELTARRLRVYGLSMDAGGVSLSLAAAAVSDGPTGVPEIDGVVARYSHVGLGARPRVAFGGAR